MKNKQIRFIAQTALLLALCVGIQQFKTLSQYITGPVVNMILILAVLAAGTWSGVTIAILSPVFALLINPSPIMMLVPQMAAVVAVGNLILVLCVGFIKDKNLIAGMASGAILKTLFLWAGISLLVIPVWGEALKDPQKQALTAMFSYNQLITAVIGGALAYIVWGRIKNVINKQ